VPLELSPVAVRRAISELQTQDPASAEDVPGALEWISGGEHGEDDPLVLTRHDLQVFLWYQLPRKWLTSLQHRHAVADALGRFLERADARAIGHAALCRSDDTHELLSLWEQDDDQAIRRFHGLLEQSGLEPPDTLLLGWGDLMGPSEAELHYRAALALEAAVEEGVLTPGAREFKRRQAATLEGFLSEPQADLGGRTPVEVIHTERMERWLERGSPERQALLEPVAALLRAPAHDPPLPAIEAALEPLSWLLQAAGEGIGLTQTGALNRAFVRAAVERYPDWWRAELFGPPNREGEISPLMELHELAGALRLVRRKGRWLMLTKKGARLRASPQELLPAAADGALATSGFPAAVEELSAAVLLAEREVPSRSLDARVHAAIAADGWHADGEPPREHDVASAVWGLIWPARVLGFLREEGEWPQRSVIVTNVGQAALSGALRRRAVAPASDW
jgi:hypothetical protein